jgi:hypothetical protein
MYYACSNLISPLASIEQISLAELIGSCELNWFISHFWGSSFQHLVETVCKHAEAVSIDVDADMLRNSCWICSFSNNQWSISTELGNGSWKESSFYLALRSSSCKGTAMVIDEFAEPLKRAWCLFEILQTLDLVGQAVPLAACSFVQQAAFLTMVRAVPILP